MYETCTYRYIEIRCRGIHYVLWTFTLNIYHPRGKGYVVVFPVYPMYTLPEKSPVCTLYIPCYIRYLSGLDLAGWENTSIL